MIKIIALAAIIFLAGCGTKEEWQAVFTKQAWIDGWNEPEIRRPGDYRYPPPIDSPEWWRWMRYQLREIERSEQLY